MDFVSGLPRSPNGHDSIWVIIDRLTKCAHFLPVRRTDSLAKLSKLYMHEIVRLHGVPLSIVSDRDPRFTSRFWRSLQKALGTELRMSTAYHPQADGQSERLIQILEDMLRSCVLDLGGSWDTHLGMAEFVYNNSYQSSAGMAPFQALYGRACRSPLCWAEAGESSLVGPDIVQSTSETVAEIRRRLIQATDDTILTVRRNLQAAQSRQKKYADIRRHDLEFRVGDLVFLRVAARKGLMKVPKLGKLAPRYVGPFLVIARVGRVAYHLRLPPQLSGLHPVFHVSMLRKADVDPKEIVNYHNLDILSDSAMEERPVRILDRRDQVLRGKVIPLVRVLWTNHGAEESTWEREDIIREQYPEAFLHPGMILNFGTKFL